MSRSLITAAALPVLLLSGCADLMKSTYQRPPVTVPAAWSQRQRTTGAPPAAGVSVAGRWWVSLKDPVLNGLIERALAANNDLAAAAIKLRRARLQAGLSKRELWPSLSETGLSASVEKSRSGGAEESRRSTLTGSVSYEVDLWGKLSRQADADHWEAAATAMDRDSTAFILTTDTATLYWKTLYFREDLALKRENIASARAIRDLVKVQYGSGAASSLELYQAEQTMEAQKAAAAQVEQRLIKTENALAILFGGPPEAPVIDGTTLPDQPLPPVQAGVPADVLSRRPDVRAAEFRLRKALASVDAKRASYLPSFSLTGSLSGSSMALKDVLSNPLTTLGAGLALPFLNWTKRSLNIQLSQAGYETAVVSFREILYKALQEVENALAKRRTATQQGEHLERAFAAAKEVERIYGVRYKAGAVSLREWLDSQDKRRDLQASLLEDRLNQRLALVELYKALGGGTGGVSGTDPMPGAEG